MLLAFKNEQEAYAYSPICLDIQNFRSAYHTIVRNSSVNNFGDPRAYDQQNHRCFIRAVIHREIRAPSCVLPTLINDFVRFYNARQWQFKAKLF